MIPIRHPGRLAAFFLLLAATCLSSPATAGYRTGPAPGWVQVQGLDLRRETPAGATGGADYLLTDLQVRHEPGREQAYSRYATRVLDASGLGEVANIEIVFDPAYQVLTLHAIDVVRDGRRLPRLAGAKVELLQREQELEARIFDGRMTAAVFLTDVRVGDVVDYSFTVEGGNPVFKGAVFGGVYTQWSVPVAHDHNRLLLAPGLSVQTRSAHGAVEPRVRVLADGYREYTWEQRDVPGVPGEADVPGWFDERPQIQWSQYRDWGEVVDWARPLYAVPARLGRELEAEIDRIAREAGTPEERLMAALRFVQSEVRYLGVEVGINSHAPSPPDQVLARRFGDCKDKTVLLLAMLDRLGIEAAPALVHTERRRGNADRLPGPTAFDHVLVRAELDGRVAWVDPTRDPQPGGLDDIHQPDFGLALVVAPGSKALVPMRSPDWQPPLREVHFSIDAREGVDAPAALEVRTVARGLAAEHLRAQLASKGSAQLGQDYHAYYAGFYTGLETAGPLSFEDDTGRNQLTLVERYTIPGLWSAPDENARRTAVVHAADLLGEMSLPGAGTRRAPLARSHPVDYLQVTDLRLPSDWALDDSVDVVEDPAFRYERRYERLERGHRIRITDRFTSRADHVEAARVPEYIARLREARTLTGFELYWDEAVAGGAGGAAGWFNGIAVFVALVWLLVLALVGAAFLLFDPPPRRGAVDPKLAGLGGWLVLPIIGLFLAPVLTLVQFLPGLEAYSADYWQQLASPGGSRYHPLWAPTLLADLCLSLTLVLAPLWVLLLVFTKRRSAPVAYIALISVSVLGQTALGITLASIPADEPIMLPEDWAALVRGWISAAIWIPYFLVSRRVRSTFVRTWRKPPAAEPPPLPPVIMATPRTQEASP